MPVVDVRWLTVVFLCVGGIFAYAFLGEALEGRQDVSAGFDCVGGGNDVGVGVGGVGVGVQGGTGRFVWVDGPGGDVDLGWRMSLCAYMLCLIQRAKTYLFTLATSIRLQEGVHVLPAVVVADSANVCLGDWLEGVTSSIAKDKLLHVGGLDLAAVVEDVAVGTDENLGEVQGGDVDLAVP